MTGKITVEQIKERAKEEGLNYAFYERSIGYVIGTVDKPTSFNDETPTSLFVTNSRDTPLDLCKEVYDHDRQNPITVNGKA